MTQPRGGTSTPVITTPDNQASIPFLGALLRLRAGSEHTGGTFALLEHTGERGYMSPLHLHRDGEETFLVLEGELRVEVGDDRHQVGPGGLALLPRDLPHGFVVVSPQARFLTLHTPGGFERFVAKAAAHGEPLGPDELTRLAAEFGVEIVGPPLLP
ncbi:quercetin dioxygenase-like cupin family protein [Catenulispora sp. MAP5-51]|uniref:cupin domain-containing protein n=1 Tax=Catenulispora sp. MAP5-51 TaxID=3156298 RepID=UPI003513E61E